MEKRKHRFEDRKEDGGEPEKGWKSRATLILNWLVDGGKGK